MKKDNKINKFNILYVDIQLVLTFMTIGAFIITIFEKKYVIWLELFLSFSLLSMAYNNIVIYKKKIVSIFYILVALVLFVLFVLRLFGIGV